MYMGMVPVLAIFERDVYLPFLFKNPMMPVQSAPARRGIDTQSGGPIELRQNFWKPPTR